MEDPKIAFIGAGNMASAMIGGLVANNYPPDHIFASDPIPDNLIRLKQQYDVITCENNDAAIATADVVILAVKPQVMGQLTTQIKDKLAVRNPLLVSIAAGITLSCLARWLGKDRPIVRCMPNTPALVQAGITGMYANERVNETHKQWTDRLLASIGVALWVDQESQLDAVTAVSGSGPAYFFLVMEAMMKAGQSLGLSSEIAEKLTLQTALGAAKMAMESDVDAGELRRRVTSPGGTTAAALTVFEQGQLLSLFERALQAANDRSSSLASELDN